MILLIWKKFTILLDSKLLFIEIPTICLFWRLWRNPHNVLYGYQDLFLWLVMEIKMEYLMVMEKFMTSKIPSLISIVVKMLPTCQKLWKCWWLVAVEQSQFPQMMILLSIIMRFLQVEKTGFWKICSSSDPLWIIVQLFSDHMEVDWYKISAKS